MKRSAKVCALTQVALAAGVRTAADLDAARDCEKSTHKFVVDTSAFLRSLPDERWRSYSDALDTIPCCGGLLRRKEAALGYLDKAIHFSGPFQCDTRSDVARLLASVNMSASHALVTVTTDAFVGQTPLVLDFGALHVGPSQLERAIQLDNATTQAVDVRVTLVGGAAPGADRVTLTPLNLRVPPGGSDMFRATLRCDEAGPVSRQFVLESAGRSLSVQVLAHVYYPSVWFNHHESINMGLFSPAPGHTKKVTLRLNNPTGTRTQVKTVVRSRRLPNSGLPPADLQVMPRELWLEPHQTSSVDLVLFDRAGYGSDFKEGDCRFDLFVGVTSASIVKQFVVSAEVVRPEWALHVGTLGGGNFSPVLPGTGIHFGACQYGHGTALRLKVCNTGRVDTVLCASIVDNNSFAFGRGDSRQCSLEIGAGKSTILTLSVQPEASDGVQHGQLCVRTFQDRRATVFPIKAHVGKPDLQIVGAKPLEFYVDATRAAVTNAAQRNGVFADAVLVVRNTGSVAAQVQLPTSGHVVALSSSGNDLRVPANATKHCWLRMVMTSLKSGEWRCDLPTTSTSQPLLPLRYCLRVDNADITMFPPAMLLCGVVVRGKTTEAEARIRVTNKGTCPASIAVRFPTSANGVTVTATIAKSRWVNDPACHGAAQHPITVCGGEGAYIRVKLRVSSTHPTGPVKIDMLVRVNGQAVRKAGSRYVGQE